jgi:hypothetical protein
MFANQFSVLEYILWVTLRGSEPVQIEASRWTCLGYCNLLNSPMVPRGHTTYVLFIWLNFVFFLAVTSQENKNCKPGRCPTHEGGRICPEQFEIKDECISDFECTGNRKCCSDGCELKCLAPASGKSSIYPADSHLFLRECHNTMVLQAQYYVGGH